MYALDCRVTIGDITFDSVNDMVVSTSIHQIMQTAKVRVPLTARLNNKGKVSKVSTADVFKVGDPVSVEMGYNGVMYPEFNGYVTRLVYGMPLTIECEDHMYILRKNHITLSEESMKVSDLVDKCLDGLYELATEVPDIVITDVVLEEEPADSVLQIIRERFGLSIFFTRLGKLYVGAQYGYRSFDVNYNFHVNIKPRSESLKYQDADEIKMKIIVKSFRKDGTYIESITGDDDGSVRTLWYYGIEDQGTLEERAIAEIERYKFSGYTGRFTTLLDPKCEPGCVANVVDPDFEERGGSYYIESVETRYGQRGAERIIEPGILLS